MRTVARHAEQHVARSEIIRARPQRITVYGSNDCPGDIDRTFGVHARHLGGLATEQRATDLLARLGHPGDDLGHEFGDEFGRGDVIEKEQRTGALYEDVVDTVVDEITAYAIPAAVAGGEFDLRAYTIGGGDENGSITEARRREQATEGAELGKHSRSVGRANCVAHQLHGTVAGVDVDACVGVVGHARTSAVARAMSVRRCAPSNVMASTPAWAASAASLSVGRTAVTASTRPPVARMSSPAVVVPA